MNLRFYLVVFFLITGYFANAQKEAAIWYFGENAGLDFNTGAPVALLDGELNTLEGCASISDNNGGLLFYTNGGTVWNRNHEIMYNGTNLFGHSNSTQSALIVPRPSTPNIYYIFTVDWEGGLNGMNYSEVDMSLDDGLGGITEMKNINLIPSSTEKITAISNSNGEDIWILAHPWESNQFYSYSVTALGVNIVPVVSDTPLFLAGFNEKVGQLKISPKGDKVGMVSHRSGAYLFDFNNITGLVSNMQTVSNSNALYGLEFSTSGKRMYTTEQKPFIQLQSIYQYDLESVNIPESEVLIANNIGVGSSLQLAIDGKIYGAVVGSSFLCSIENPNELGVASNYIYNSIDLNGRMCLNGLPPFIQSYFSFSFTTDNLCSGSPTNFKINLSETGATVFWDFGDGNTSILENPSHTYATAGDYTVSVTVTTAAETKTETKDITIFETPLALPLADLEGCITQNTYNIDLPSFNGSILGAQDPTMFTLDYFLSQADADVNTNALEAVHPFPLGSTPVFVRVSNMNNTKCYDTTQFTIIARQAPIVDVITDWTVCDDDTDGFYTFDLSLKYDEIFNGQDETKFEILYFSSQADADSSTNPLSINHTNTLTSEEIFVRFQNIMYPTCYRTGNFTIEVSSGVAANTPTNLEICDDNNDGFYNFNLADTEPEIIGAQNASSLSISYHATIADAEAGTNLLPTSYTNTVASNQTIYVRVENASDANCYAITSFEVNVYDSPQLQTVTDWVVCDNDNDGVFDFNLTEKNSEILGSQNPSNVSIRYYESLADANLAQNEITGTYQNPANPQTIFYRLDNRLNATCFVTDSFDVQVFETPFALTPTAIIGCDINETGSQTIDLAQKTIEILGNQDPNLFIVAFYASQSDAENSINELNTNMYVNSQSQETLYARVERNNLESCYAITTLEIIINSLPRPVLEERYVICPDSPALIIDGGDFESWSWQDANGTEISTSRIFDVVDLGEYQLTVSQTMNGITCENSVLFEVLSSGAPESMEVETNGFSDQIDVTVTATGTGHFEYSVDGENYQASNEFKVFPGKYTVYVRDLLECRMLSEELIAIGYQRFFTPNGDGSNEYWNIIGAELYPASQLFIYDRYGKFIAQLSPNSKGWDGSYNGNPLPASDYWFNYQYANDQTMTGHFTLKR